jgi:hypothetical protein
MIYKPQCTINCSYWIIHGLSEYKVLEISGSNPYDQTSAFITKVFAYKITLIIYQ